MKYVKLIILSLILTGLVQADAPRRHYDRHHNDHYYRHYRSPNFYWGYRYYSPVVVRTYTQTSTTTTPQNLITLTADVIAEDILRLSNMMAQGLITDMEFERSKKTLLNRIGMRINPDAAELSTSELLDQIEILYRMQLNQLITKKEFSQQKSKLLTQL